MGQFTLGVAILITLAKNPPFLSNLAQISIYVILCNKLHSFEAMEQRYVKAFAF